MISTGLWFTVLYLLLVSGFLIPPNVKIHSRLYDMSRIACPSIDYSYSCPKSLRPVLVDLFEARHMAREASLPRLGGVKLGNWEFTRFILNDQFRILLYLLHFGIDSRFAVLIIPIKWVKVTLPSHLRGGVHLLSLIAPLTKGMVAFH